MKINGITIGSGTSGSSGTNGANGTNGSSGSSGTNGTSGNIRVIASVENLTTNTTGGIVVLGSADISAEIASGSMYQVMASFRKTVGTANFTPRLYFNTSATTAGATLLAVLGSQSALNSISDNIINFTVLGSSVYVTNSAGTVFSRYATSTGTVSTVTNPFYLIWAYQLTSNLTDQAVLLKSQVVRYV